MEQIMNAHRHTILRTFLALALAVPAITASWSPAAWAGDTNHVVIKDFAFSPKALTVAPGTTVTWVNQDDEAHQLMSKGKEFRSPALDTNDVFSFTFSKSGTYDYFCTLHPQMIGTIVVK
jgi:plastocyanin